MKYFLIAGEASGDLHGSNLMKGLKTNDPDAQFSFFGGDLMKEQGGTLIKHYRQMAFMGIISVLRNLRLINENFKDCRNAILSYNPDVLILIDYAGFNLRMAKFAKSKGIKVFYYISPKVWAWKKSRVKQIKAYVDRLYVIFPFESKFFKKHNYDVYYAGNPLVDAVYNFKQQCESYESFISRNELEDKPILALLAGSRKQEIEHCLTDMIKGTLHLKDYQFVIAGAPSIEPSFYSKFTANTKVSIVYGQTYLLLNYAKAAVVTSGTATLETALFKVPQVVVYKTQIFTYLIGKMLVRIPYFSLVNIIAEKEIVKEYLQFDLAQNIKNELDKIIENIEYRNAMLEGYYAIEQMLGKPGASDRFASMMIDALKTEAFNN